MKEQPEGFTCIPNFLSRTEQVSILHELPSLSYMHNVLLGKTSKRGYCQFGYAYNFTSHEIEFAPPIPDFLQTVIQKARPYCPTNTMFNQCEVTHYPSCIGAYWHTENPLFNDYILGVFIASEALLQFRPKYVEPKYVKKLSFEVTVPPGSLYMLQGVLRWHYEHQVIPVKEERYSLTFRSVDGSLRALLLYKQKKGRR
jgi:2OG-Fe(II) oxygenase superfamily